MLVAVCADKGAPGATSTALVLGAVWPRRAVVVELDPSGGDLSLRCRHVSGGQLAATPNLLGLTAAVRSGGVDADVITRYAQPLKSGGLVVPGVMSAEQAAGMVQLWPAVADACVDADVDVVADLGRISTGAPTMPVAAAADTVVVVATASLEGVLHLRERLTHLITALGRRGSGAATRVLPVLVTSDRHAHVELAEVTDVLATAGLPFAEVGFVAHDPAALQRLQDGESPEGRLRRSLLIRTARTVVDQLHDTPQAVAS